MSKVVKTLLLKSIAILLLSGISGVTYAQVTYCIPVHGRQYLGSIVDAVTLNTISNIGTTFPQTSTGYSNYTSMQTSLQAGSSYTITISTAEAFPHNFAAWIDYDQNGEFSPGERLGLQALTTFNVATANWTFTVPSNALTGATRLRVRGIAEPFGPWNLSHHPCIPAEEGEVEDYTVVITSGSSVDVSPTLLVSPVSSVGLGVEAVTVRLSNRGNSPVNSAMVQYHLNGVLQSTEPITQTIPANGSIDHTFLNTLNLSAANCADLKFTVLAPGDQNSLNDTLEDRACGLNPVTGSNVYYIKSNQFYPMETWSAGTTNQTTLNTVFGVGNWQLAYFETLNPNTIFSSNTCTIFIDGSYLDVDPLEIFLAQNMKRIEDWVAAGGHLFLNSSPDSQNYGDELPMDWGFGGVQMVQGYSVTYAVPVQGQPVNNGPYQPNGSEWDGFYYANSVLYGPGLTAIAVDNNDAHYSGPELNLPILAKKTWGNGFALFGTIGASDQMGDPATAMNHRANILEHLWQCCGNTTIDAQSACGSYTWPVNGVTYTSSTNSPVVNFNNPSGCNGTVNLNLTIHPTNSVIDLQNACGSYTWPLNGVTYTSSTNTPTVTLTNVAGCDSVVTLNLTLNANYATDVQEACDSYTWPLNGMTYTYSTNTPSVTYTNGAGCDSIVTLDLTINNSAETQVYAACNSFTWPLNGVTYTSSTNTPTVTLTNVHGCDSVVTLFLTINQPNTGTDVQVACDSYTWPLNGVTYTSSTNTPMATIVNAAGCDSLVTLDLTINTVGVGVTNNSPTLTATTVGATYQWLDCDNSFTEIPGETNQTFTATVNGNYAVEVTQNGCTDTSICQLVNNLGILENDFGNSLTMHPNPTKGDLFIDLGTKYNEISVIVRNMLGQEILRKTYNDAQAFHLNVPWAAGQYMIEINSGDKKALVKVIKE